MCFEDHAIEVYYDQIPFEPIQSNLQFHDLNFKHPLKLDLGVIRTLTEISLWEHIPDSLLDILIQIPLMTGSLPTTFLYI